MSNIFFWFLNQGIKISCILGAALVVNYIGRIFVKRVIQKIVSREGKIKDKVAEKRREDTLIGILNSSLATFVWIVAILMVLPEFGVNIGPLLAGAGLVGLAIGMASREIITDFLSGFFIILENRYQIGDQVKIAGIEGKVKDISLRRTILEDKKGEMHFIPNGQVKITSRSR